MATDVPDWAELAATLGGGQVRHARRLSGGASQETWAFDLLRDGAMQPLILRRAPPGGQRPGSLCAGLDKEFELLRLAAVGGVPVPRVLACLPAAQGQGYVMQRLEGQTLGRRIVADGRFAGARAVLAGQCGQALARIHALPLERAPTLRQATVDAEITHYQKWHALHGTQRPVFQLALRWLRAQQPPDAARALVHGDFRNGNLMVDEQGLAGVLDWELAHIGDPMQDLGWLCVNSWRFGQSELPVGGFGTRQALFDGYVEAGGRLDAARVRFWEVFGTLQWGVICDSMAQAWLDDMDRRLDRGLDRDVDRGLDRDVDRDVERDVERAAIGRRASETEIDLLALLSPRAGAEL